MNTPARINTALAALVILGAAAVMMGITLPDFLHNWQRAFDRYPYVEATGWDLPMLLGIPALLLLSTGMLLRVFDRATERRLGRILKLATIFALIAIGTRIIYGFVVSWYLTSAGYSKCWTLTDPSLYARATWVNHADYCVENAGPFRGQLLAWIDTQVAQGREVRPENVQRAAQELLAESVTAGQVGNP